jgi:hypothetical protein
MQITVPLSVESLEFILIRWKLAEEFASNLRPDSIGEGALRSLLQIDIPALFFEIIRLRPELDMTAR